jgi:hypothetical protein
VTHWALSSGVAIAANASVAQQRAAVMEALGGQDFVSSSFNANQLGVVIGGMVDTLYGAMIDWMTTAIAIQIGQGSCAGALSPAVAAMFDGYSVDPATGNVSAPADATFAQMRANGTFSQVLFQYLRSGASGAAPTSDPIWPLVADWAAKMPSGTDLTKYIIRQDLAVFDTFAAVWGGVWAAPGVMDLMYAVGAPLQTKVRTHTSLNSLYNTVSWRL